jgi:integrase/recombinase XerD
MMYFKFEFSLGKGKKQAATKKEKKVLGWKIVHSQVEMLKKEEKFKTASNYLTAARSWTKFLQREDWTFSEMDSQEVELYQRWLSDKGICLNTMMKNQLSVLLSELMVQRLVLLPTLTVTSP